MLGPAGVRRDRTPIPKVPMPAARWFGSSLNVQAPPREGWQRRGMAQAQLRTHPVRHGADLSLLGSPDARLYDRDGRNVAVRGRTACWTGPLEAARPQRINIAAHRCWHGANPPRATESAQPKYGIPVSHKRWPLVLEAILLVSASTVVTLLGAYFVPA
jgi:hypothetical protein